MIVRKPLEIGEKVIYDGKLALDNKKGIIRTTKYGRVISREKIELDGKNIKLIRCLFTDGSYEAFYEKVGFYERADKYYCTKECLRRPNCIERLFDIFDINPDKKIRSISP